MNFLKGIVLAALVAITATLAYGDASYSTKAGFKQGGDTLYIKSGGDLELASGGTISANGTVTVSSVGALSVATGGEINIRGASLFQLPVFIGNIGISSASAAVLAPFPGAVTSIKCATDVQAIDGTTSLYLRINGSQITSGSVIGILSTTSAYQVTDSISITGGTVGQGSTIEIQSDGTTSANPKTACSIFITP